MYAHRLVKFGLVAGVLFVAVSVANGSSAPDAASVPAESRGYAALLAKGDPDPNAEPPVQNVKTTGAVTWPAGSTAGFKVLSSTAEAPVTGDHYEVEVVHTAGRPTLQFATNTLGNPVLAAVYIGTGMPVIDFNVASTAFALAFYDQAILGLPDDTRATAANLVHQHSGMPGLESAVAAAIDADPSDPLNGETHPELYEQGVAIARDVMNVVQPVSAAAAVAAATAWASADDDEDAPATYVHVNDDADNKTDDVKLFNGSFAYYGVKVTLDGQPFGGTDASPIFLWRRKPTSFTWTWPPTAGVERTVPLGDGNLGFEFDMMKDLTAFDFLYSLATHAIGIGASSPGKLEANYRLFLSSGAFILAGVKEFVFATAPEGGGSRGRPPASGSGGSAPPPATRRSSS